jgi:hypothetical protein
MSSDNLYENRVRKKEGEKKPMRQISVSRFQLITYIKEDIEHFSLSLSLSLSHRDVHHPPSPSIASLLIRSP